jgi:hypothetical protein
MDWRRREFRHGEQSGPETARRHPERRVRNCQSGRSSRGRSAERGKKLVLITAPETLSQLCDVGVRVAGIASNHSLDAGAEGPQQTV